MKRFTTLLFLAFTAVSLSAQIMDDDLSSYNIGTALSGQGIWSNATATWGAGGGTAVNVANIPLTYSGYSTTAKSATFIASGDSPGRDFNGTAITSGTVYIGFLVKFSSVTTSTTNTAGQIMRLRDKAGSFSSPARICANSFASGTFKFSISKEGVAGTTALTTNTYALANTHLVVIKYTVNSGTTDDVASIIIDPTAGAAEPAADATMSTGTDQYTGINQVQGFNIFQSFGAANGGQMSSFRVATTYADLFPTCFTPVSPLVTSISPVSGFLSWTVPTNGTPPGSYDYEINTTNVFTGTPSVGGTNLTSTSTLLLGLTPNTTYYVKVRSNCGFGSGSSSWSGVIVFKTLANCPTLDPPFLSNLTSTSAQVNVIVNPAAGQVTPSSYDYEFTTAAGIFTNTPTGNFTGTFTPLSGLTPNTAYKVQVRANCGGGDYSPTWTTTTFSTPCTAYNISSTPFTEGFNTTSTSYPCWTRSFISGPANTTPYGIAQVTTLVSPNCSKYEGDRSISYNCFTLLASNSARLISPTFTTMGMTQVEMSFAATENYNASYSYEDQLTAEYSIDGGGTWTAIGDVWRNNPALISGDTARWVVRNFILPSNAINQSNLKIALKFTSQYGMNFFVDNFKIGGPSTIANLDANTCDALDVRNAWRNNVIPVNGKNWFRIINAGGTVVDINPNGNNLGAMTMSYKENLSGPSNVPYASGVAYIPRYFAIKPTTQPTTPVALRLFFQNTELADYVTSSGIIGSLKNTLNVSKFTNTNGIDDCVPSLITAGTGLVIPFSAITAVDYGTGFYLEFNVSSFSEFGALSQNFVIPIELKSLKATANGNQNRVEWTTATELNVAYFNIQRATDGQTDWTTIGTVKAVGTTKTEQSYRFDDANPTDIAYYRLVTKDNDGKESTSKTVSVLRSIKHLSIQKVSPNPFYTEGSSVEVLVGKSSKLSVVVTDVLGKIIKTQTFNVQEGATTLPLSFTNLAQGTYILTINDGETIATQRIVKH
jgi:hypothetical protein